MKILGMLNCCSFQIILSDLPSTNVEILPYKTIIKWNLVCHPKEIMQTDSVWKQSAKKQNFSQKIVVEEITWEK